MKEKDTIAALGGGEISLLWTRNGLHFKHYLKKGEGGYLSN